MRNLFAACSRVVAGLLGEEKERLFRQLAAECGYSIQLLAATPTAAYRPPHVCLSEPPVASPKQQEQDYDQQDETKAAASVVADPRAHIVSAAASEE